MLSFLACSVLGIWFLLLSGYMLSVNRDGVERKAGAAYGAEYKRYFENCLDRAATYSGGGLAWERAKTGCRIDAEEAARKAAANFRSR